MIILYLQRHIVLLLATLHWFFLLFSLLLSWIQFTELSCGGSATQFTSQVPLPVPYIESVVYCNYCSKHYLIAQTTE